MKITNVEIKLIKEENIPVVGIASIVLNKCFVINDIRIIKGKNGLFLAMPSRKTDSGYRDVVHPINKETRKLFEDAIYAKYMEVNK